MPPADLLESLWLTLRPTTGVWDWVQSEILSGNADGKAFCIRVSTVRAVDAIVIFNCYKNIKGLEEVDGVLYAQTALITDPDGRAAVLSEMAYAAHPCSRAVSSLFWNRFTRSRRMDRALMSRS